MKTKPTGFELMDPTTNRASGLAMVGGNACIEAGVSGIPHMIQLVDSMKFIRCGGKDYLRLHDVVGWHVREIEAVAADEGVLYSDQKYAIRLHDQLDRLKKMKELVEAYVPEAP